MMLSSSPAMLPMASPPTTMITASGAVAAAALARLSTDKTGEVAQRWMEMILGEKFAQSFPVVLLSGEWLCALANKVFQALGMKDNRCEATPTTWPAAMSGGITDETDAWATRDSSGGDVWMQQKRLARQNIDAYLRACALIGVVPQDCFHPDDLLELRDLDKVYRNILALQNVAFVEEEEAFFVLTKLIKLVPDDYYSTMTEKDTILKTNTYGDMLKHLNEDF
ncbi:hypothetical protein ATCC90586_000122 [Pythium insidiosum]|nr:hypothetical protein ATCC90586_000122 [Pythium insidiosum]